MAAMAPMPAPILPHSLRVFAGTLRASWARLRLATDNCEPSFDGKLLPGSESADQCGSILVIPFIDVNDVTIARILSMNAEDLRAIQAPLKEQYRAAPETAQVTMRSQGRIGEGISCKIETGQALVVAGLHRATGGTGMAACSGDMLLDALVACAGVTLNAVATALGITLRAATLQAEGDLDFRGTLGISKEVPVGVQNIRLQFTLDTDASEEELDTLLRLTERYCVVYQTLAHPPALTVARKRGGTDAERKIEPA
jgi:uncharacterized OsmC-like protein